MAEEHSELPSETFFFYIKSQFKINMIAHEYFIF